MADHKNFWARADRVSDDIIDLVNARKREPDFEIMHIFAGQLLALTGVMKTAGTLEVPTEFIVVRLAVEECLLSMKAAFK